jgi:molecular chaperone DnaK
VVTPETTSQPFVSGDVLRQMDAGEQEQEQDREPAPAPLLLDVTPHTLGVATVGGYVEVLVHKNSPVPIEKAHLFTTSVDDQDRAVIKVLEGESPRAEENHVLGEVELPDIRKAPRGEIKIEVTYEITVDGILQVSGRNLETGEAQTARLTLFGG